MSDPSPEVPRPADDPDTVPGKQRELKLNVGIGIVGTVLSAAVAVVFFLVLDEPVLGVVFVVVAVLAAAAVARAAQRRSRARSTASGEPSAQ